MYLLERLKKKKKLHALRLKKKFKKIIFYFALN